MVCTKQTSGASNVEGGNAIRCNNIIPRENLQTLNSVLKNGGEMS